MGAHTPSMRPSLKGCTEMSTLVYTFLHSTLAIHLRYPPQAHWAICPPLRSVPPLMLQCHQGQCETGRGCTAGPKAGEREQGLLSAEGGAWWGESDSVSLLTLHPGCLIVVFCRQAAGLASSSPLCRQQAWPRPACRMRTTALCTSMAAMRHVSL